MRKELAIYLIVLVLSAMLIHPDLLTSPLKRLDLMSERANYYHPFVFALAPYLVITLLRLLIQGLKKLANH